MPSREHQRRRLLLVTLVVAACLLVDQLSKRWAFDNLRGRPRDPLIPGFVELDFYFNPGSAFGMFAHSPGARFVFIAVTLVALVYMVWLLLRLPREGGPLGPLALALMIGGALGNLVDRLTRVYEVRVYLTEELPFWALIEHPQIIADAVTRGRPFADLPRHGVVDFIVVYYWPGRPWPSFNVADACLVVGVALFLLYLIRHGRALTDED